MNSALERTGAAIVCVHSFVTRATSRPDSARRPRWRSAKVVTAVTLAALAAPAAAGGAELIGHRGARGLAPENTIGGFLTAIALGVDAVEADVVVTRDRRVVLAHDLHVNRHLCGGPGVGRPYAALTYAQVRRLDCGQWRARGLLARTQRPAPGSKVPRLAKLFAVGRPAGVGFLVDLKRDPAVPRRAFARLLVAEVRRAGMLDRTTVQSFEWGVLRAVARIEPRLALMPLASPAPGDDIVGAARGAGFSRLAVPVTAIDPERVQRAAAAGIRLTVHGVDDATTARALAAVGVAGIVTDYPDRLRDAVAATGRPRG
jgi:glycerophosphoryl diester phosphodiesterase